jgi:hypothetical protein
MRNIEGDPAFVASWDEAMKYQRLKKAAESQAVDLTLLASTPMHDRLTFERAEAVEEKLAEQMRQGGPSKFYKGWMEEIERTVAHLEQLGESEPHTSRKRHNRPSQSRCVMLCGVILSLALKGEQFDREGPNAEGSGSRSAASRARPRRAQGRGGTLAYTLDDNRDSGDSHSQHSDLKHPGGETFWYVLVHV